MDLTGQVLSDVHNSLNSSNARGPAVSVMPKATTAFQVAPAPATQRVVLSEKDPQAADNGASFSTAASEEIFGNFLIKSQGSDKHDHEINVAEAFTMLSSALKSPEEPQIPADLSIAAQTSITLIEKQNVGKKAEIEATLNAIYSYQVNGDNSDSQGNSDVNGIVSRVDDPSIPVNTVRAWFLGLLFSILGAGINNFFAERLPGISVTAFVAQLIAYPAGKLLERTLPTKKRIWFGRSWSLNPGSFSAKEHMLITIMANVSFGSAYATSIIITQRLPIFYNQTWAKSWGYQILLVISTQILGYGLAGMSRKFLVYPAAAFWPGVLPVLALNKSFHDEKNEPANGWRVSRIKWFSFLFVISGVYYILPNWLFTSVSQFNWLSWSAPNNPVLAGITGSYTGIGLNPVPTLDYNIVSSIVDPLITPYFAVINLVVGMLIMGVIFLPAIWFSNTWFTSYMPVVSNRPFDRFGKRYQVSKILNSAGRLDVTAYEKYSPVYLSAANALTFGGYFALYPATLMYSYLYHGTEIANAFKNIFGKGPKTKQDVHMRLMSKYKEVPEYWYLIVMLVGAIMAFIMIAKYPTDMPIWGIFFALGLGVIFIVPIGLISAVSNVEIGLNVLSEMVAGFAMPGKPLAMMIFKTYGTITLSQGLSFAADLKLGHYAKIPPRTLFTAQMVSTVLSAFITLGVTNWQINNIEDFCSQTQKQKFSCPGANTFFTSSVIWGAIGPKHNYGKGGLYNILLWGFLIGFLIPVPFYLASRKWPRSWAKDVHPPILLAGFILWAPLNLSYITAAVPTAYVFGVYIKKRFYSWWVKYNYVTATGLNTGIATAGLLMFIILQNQGINVDWIGNTIGTDGCDQKGCGLRALAPGQSFGPGVGDFKYNN